MLLTFKRVKGPQRTGLVVSMAVLVLTAALPTRVAGADSSLLKRSVTLGGPGHAEMYPSGLEIGPDGSVLVADTGNSRILKYAADGTFVWTVGAPGSGIEELNDPRDVGVDSAGNVFVADTGNLRVVKLSSEGVWQGSWKGPTTDRLGSPMGLTVTGDKVYVADAGKKKVRVIDTSLSTQVTSFSQNGACTFSAIRDVDADADGNVYIANYLRNDMLKMDSTGICIRTWGTKGSAPGQFLNPYGVRLAVDPVRGAQSVYVADSNNNRVQQFDLDGAFIAAVGSTGDYTQPGTFGGMRRVAVAADGDIWGADLWSYRVSRFDRAAEGYSYAQTIGGIPPPLSRSAVFNQLGAVSFDASGVIHAVDTVNQRIVRMAPDGEILNACGQRGWTKGAFNWPRGVAVDQASSSQEIWVADTKQNRIQVIRPDCSPVRTISTLGSIGGALNWPQSLAIRQADRVLWIADTRNHRIVAYDILNRVFIGSFGSSGSTDGKFILPSAVFIDPVSQHVFVADSGNNRIVELSDVGGSQVAVVRSYRSSLLRPEGVAAANGRIFVADTGHSQIVALDRETGTRIAESEPGDFSSPTSLSVGPGGELLVSDTYNDRLKVHLVAP